MVHSSAGLCVTKAAIKIAVRPATKEPATVQEDFNEMLPSYGLETGKANIIETRNPFGWVPGAVSQQSQGLSARGLRPRARAMRTARERGASYSHRAKTDLLAVPNYVPFAVSRLSISRLLACGGGGDRRRIRMGR